MSTNKWKQRKNCVQAIKADVSREEQWGGVWRLSSGPCWHWCWSRRRPFQTAMTRRRWRSGRVGFSRAVMSSTKSFTRWRATMNQRLILWSLRTQLTHLTLVYTMLPVAEQLYRLFASQLYRNCSSPIYLLRSVAFCQHVFIHVCDDDA